MTNVFNSLTGIPFSVTSKALISTGQSIFTNNDKHDPHVENWFLQTNFIYGVRMYPQRDSNEIGSTVNCIDSAMTFSNLILFAIGGDFSTVISTLTYIRFRPFLNRYNFPCTLR